MFLCSAPRGDGGEYFSEPLISAVLRRRLAGSRNLFRMRMMSVEEKSLLALRLPGFSTSYRSAPDQQSITQSDGCRLFESTSLAEWNRSHQDRVDGRNNKKKLAARSGKYPPDEPCLAFYLFYSPLTSQSRGEIVFLLLPLLRLSARR
jgi:hypothetical protein